MLTKCKHSKAKVAKNDWHIKIKSLAEMLNASAMKQENRERRSESGCCDPK